MIVVHSTIYHAGLLFIIYYLFMVVWGLALWSWGSCRGFLGLGFSAERVWGPWCGAIWVFWGWGFLYKHRRITLGKQICRWILAIFVLSLSVQLLVQIYGNSTGMNYAYHNNFPEWNQTIIQILVAHIKQLSSHNKSNIINSGTFVQWISGAKLHLAINLPQLHLKFFMPWIKYTQYPL